MTTPAVDTVEQIDAQWLTAGLRDGGIDATVRTVAAEPVGTGQMGSCFRLRIDYAAGDGPQRLIVKLPAADLNSRAAGSLSYRCETSFYREFAHRITARVPQCFLSVTDEANNGFTLLLEDVAPAEAGDQIAGCSIEEARAAAINVAGLHAPTWNSPSVRELDWAIPDLTAMPEFTGELLANATKQFLERYTVDRATASVLQRYSGEFVAWATGAVLNAAR
jgi:hypothetical protein